MCTGLAPVLLVLIATPIYADAQKEFADCGSTALMPLKLELDPDPAEVLPAYATFPTDLLRLGAR